MGPVITRAEAQTQPEFQEGGRVEFWRSDPIKFWLTGGRSGIGVHGLPHLTVLGLVFVAIVRGRKLRDTPPALLDNAVVALGLFALAHAVLFRLHLPNRYTRYALPLSAILVVAAHLWPAVQEWRARSTMGRRVAALAVRTWKPAVAVGLLLLAALVTNAMSGAWRPVQRAQVEFYEFVASLPVDARLAGNVSLAGVPLFSRRSVLVDPEFALPYLRGYYREVQRRQDALRAALASRSRPGLAQFCREFGVTHLVLSRTQPLPPAGANRPPAERLLENERYLVVTCPREAGS
jgi:hypothetical protein